jgi:protein-arginine kinase activator protein McsA
METVQAGLSSIREFFERFGHEEAFDLANEVKVLKKFARDIQRKMPVDPLQKLHAQLQKAIKAEKYEEAARLRDQIKSLSS